MSSRAGVAAPRAARQASWNALASTMKPGVQNPHCNASRAMKARCTGCNLPPPTPSTVVTLLPAAAFAGRRQLATGTPSSRTVQAPQTPAPHTSLVPVRRRRSRRTSTRSASASSGSIAARPLIRTPVMAVSLRGGARSIRQPRRSLRRPSGERSVRDRRTLASALLRLRPCAASSTERANSTGVMPSRKAILPAASVRSIAPVIRLNLRSMKLWWRSRVWRCCSERSSSNWAEPLTCIRRMT
jgi:cobalamin biosynthesis Mg chelatase CobN